MKFGDKYKTKEDTNPDKKELSDDAFAIGETLQELINMINLKGGI